MSPPLFQRPRNVVPEIPQLPTKNALLTMFCEAEHKLLDFSQGAASPMVHICHNLLHLKSNGAKLGIFLT
jgi:hypothetical protein